MLFRSTDNLTRYNKDSPTSIGGEMNCKQEKTAMISGFLHIMDYEENQIFLCECNFTCGAVE